MREAGELGLQVLGGNHYFRGGRRRGSRGACPRAQLLHRENVAPVQDGLATHAGSRRTGSERSDASLSLGATFRSGTTPPSGGLSLILDMCAYRWRSEDLSGFGNGRSCDNSVESKDRLEPLFLPLLFSGSSGDATASCHAPVNAAGAGNFRSHVIRIA